MFTFNDTANNHILMNPSININWAGWRTTSYDLGEAGWQLSVMEDVYRRRFQMAIKQPQLRIYGLGEFATSFDHYRMRSDYGAFNDFIKEVPLYIKYMSQDLHVQVIAHDFDFDRFAPVDHVPRICTDEIKNMDDLKLFAPIGGQEIIVSKDESHKWIKEILKAQEPKQAEIRAKKQKEYRKLLRDARGMDNTGKYNLDLKPEVECIARLITI